MAAMFLCGLWHGAAWNFVLWGLYHGIGLGLESIVNRLRPGWFEDHPIWTGARWVACYGFVTYGRLLFFYPASTVWRMTADSKVEWPYLMAIYERAGRIKVMSWPLEGPESGPGLIRSKGRHLSPAAERLMALFEG
jgi:hypothetical protein